MDGTAFPVSGTRMLPLTVLDQVAPRIYVRLVFTFRLQDGYNPDDARKHLEARLHHSFRRWPFLAGQLRPVITEADGDDSNTAADNGGIIMDTGSRGSLELVFDPDDTHAMDPRLRPDIFRYDALEKVLIGGEAISYDTLVARGMPPSAMDKDVFSLSPQHPQPGASCPPVTLKATELAGGGGLFLCFAFHHGILDGGFIRTFLDYFASGEEALEDDNGDDDDDDDDDDNDYDYEAELSSMSSLLDETVQQEEEEHAVLRHDELPEYDFGDGYELAGAETDGGTDSSRATCRIFRFDHAVLQELHGMAVEQQPHDGFLSTVDVLCALVQVHVCRARYKAGLLRGGGGRIGPDEPAAFSTAGDFRDRGATARRSRGSWGNMWAQVMVMDSGATVRRLIALHDDDNDAVAVPEDPIPAVLAQARRIRAAIAAAGADADYMPKRIALARRLLASDVGSSISSSMSSSISSNMSSSISISSASTSTSISCGDDEAHAVLGAAHGRALQPGRAGLGCSVWAHMGADACFAIPGTEGDGRADFVRKTWSASDGSMNVMQRRGGTKAGREPWEVLLALRREDMEVLCRDDELGRWASGWVE
ncbi:hypothetical protein MAPG_04652, partial [Magnaporthiopsis poae ATCC 64411]|uniref:Trichothecene 3-O-acetyltransferase n=1 Tax=Magnaporthiopsis poae (strain ATCC 64411 / 73-15) TaxID=644358 RepID=A0A0C4DXB1_MAGP6